MQVIPKDTGWDTLADAMMKLYNAEIHNKALNLQQLNSTIELARQTGNKKWLEQLTFCQKDRYGALARSLIRTYALL